jgi:hypothetical protein
MPKTTRRTFLATAAALTAGARALPGAELAARGAAQPRRLRRSECFLGLHFDFHAGPDCTEIGRRTTRGMIETIIGEVRPDYIQIDCKGHRGLSSYPTKVGHPAPGFVGDQLRLWREVTAQHGVSLFLHYSGVADDEAIIRHPEWATVNADGKPDARATSVFGPYVDRLLIPQLEELIDVYDVDGVWVDGDCWAAKHDFASRVLAEFSRKTGITAAPRTAADPHFFEFTEFCREGFRRYVAHYVDALHAHRPAVQVTSNWSYSHFMPEPVTMNVDWLSGDYSQTDSVNSARLAARYLSQQGKPWDLMAWSFAGPSSGATRSQKSVVQLQREAAIVLASGGGFQAYFHQRRDASIDVRQMPAMGEVAKFARARQAVCQNTERVPQMALLHSSAAYYRKSARLFSPGNTLQALEGVLQALLNSQHAVDVVSEHHIRDRIADWPLVIVPECEYLDEVFTSALVDYAKGGGTLLLVGPKAAQLFERELGVTIESEIGAEAENRFLEHGDQLVGIRGPAARVRPSGGTRTVGRVLAKEDRDEPGTPAATIASLGSGHVAAVWLPLGSAYLSARTVLVRDFLDSVVRELFPNPLVTVRGSRFVDVILRRRRSELQVHVINTAGPHEDPRQPTFDDIPPVGPLEVLIRMPHAPRAVVRQPSGEALRVSYRGGIASVSLPRLAIYEIIVAQA